MAVVVESSRTVKPPDRRKLIAVVHADMVGYSRLIGLDEDLYRASGRRDSRSAARNPA